MTTITIKIPQWLDNIFVWPLLFYRKYKSGSPYRLIPLGRNFYTKVDPENFYYLNQFHWTTHGSGNHIYAVRNDVTSNGKTKTIRMHRVILNAPSNLLVDHANHYTLDNLRCNLRLATPSQNMCNRKKTINSKTSSEYFGLAYIKSRNQWSCRLSYQRKRIWLGYFDSEIDAARAHDVAALKYHGEFARLNFPHRSSNINNLRGEEKTLKNTPKKGNLKLNLIIKEPYKMIKSQKVILASIAVVIAIMFGCSKETQKPQAAKTKPPLKTDYIADWNSLARRNPAPDWFRDAKLGIYFHWGVYSVPAFGNEWYPRNMYDIKSPEYRHHVKTWGEPNVFGYPDFVPMFKAEKFDANEWADLFVKTGARFAGPVAEHHDGFSMWASKLTPWNAKDMGPHRDCVGELEKAIRGRGMRFVTTFHHERNGLYEITKDGKAYWTGHYEFVKKNFPELLEDPCRAIMYGYMPKEKYFQMWEDKLIEVIDHYHPDLMYFDSWLDEIPDSYKMGYLAHYFNDAGKLGKEVVVTYKQEDLPKDVGMPDYEKGRADKLTNYVWLTDDTVSRGSWCWTQGLAIKKPVEIVRTMIDIVSKNGQLMLNISPMADGTIPDNQKQVLLAIGEWMGKYGEAIYGTRPFVDYGEGPTKMQSSGMFARMKGGYNAKDIRYTRKGDTVYAMALGWPGGNQKVTMTIFGKEGKAGNIKVKKVTMLGTKERIKWHRTDEGLIVTTPKKEVDDMAIVFKLSVAE